MLILLVSFLKMIVLTTKMRLVIQLKLYARSYARIVPPQDPHDACGCTCWSHLISLAQTVNLTYALKCRFAESSILGVVNIASRKYDA